MCPSQQFLEGHFFFFSAGGGWGLPYLFYSNIPGVMLTTSAVFKSELNIQSLSRGKAKKVYSREIDLRFHFWQSKQNIPFGGSNFSHL